VTNAGLTILAGGNVNLRTDAVDQFGKDCDCPSNNPIRSAIIEVDRLSFAPLVGRARRPHVDAQTSAQLRLENLALRQQLAVLRRSAPRRLRLTPADRIFWVWLRRVWSDWKSALMIVKAETVVAWHRKGFRLFWTWKIGRGQPGRPSVPDPDDEP
jgi:hypothetical protein